MWRKSHTITTVPVATDRWSYLQFKLGCKSVRASRQAAVYRKNFFLSHLRARQLPSKVPADARISTRLSSRIRGRAHSALFTPLPYIFIFQCCCHSNDGFKCFHSTYDDNLVATFRSNSLPHFSW